LNKKTIEGKKYWGRRNPAPCLPTN